MATFRISGGTVTLPSSSVGDEQVLTPTGSESTIDADKLQHLFKAGTNFNLAIGGTPAAREEIVFVMATAGQLRGVHGLMNVTGTTGSITLDLKVNGTTALSSTFSVANTDANRAIIDGSISTASVSAGDVISLEMSVSSSDGTGPYAWVEIEEDAA